MSEQNLWQNSRFAEFAAGTIFAPGGAAPVDQALLHQLAVDPGPEQMASLSKRCADAVCLAVAGAHRPAGLDCRTVQLPAAGVSAGVFVLDGFEVFAAAGVPHGGPFRRSRPSGSGWPTTQRHGAGDGQGRRDGHNRPLDGWARLIERALATGTHSVPGRADLEATIRPVIGRSARLGPAIAGRAWTRRNFGGERRDRGNRPAHRPPSPGGAHAAHQQFEKKHGGVHRVGCRRLRPSTTVLPAGSPRKTGASRRPGVRSDIGPDQVAGTTPDGLAEVTRRVGR